jgi:hypothetical protein
MLPDIGQFDDIVHFPFPITFWRPAAETRVRHRNPLMDSRIGVSHERLAIDLLHTLFLGPAVVLVGHCFWFLIEADAWNILGEHSPDDRRQMSIQQLRVQLWAWYSRKRREGEQLCQLEDLNLSMLGGKPFKVPNFKAVETKHILPFVLELLGMFESKIAGTEISYLLGPTTAMVDLVRVIYSSPSLVTPGALQSMCDAYNRFMLYCELAGVAYKPKCHLLAHLVQMSVAQGNPRDYACFEDEGLNAVLKAIGIVAHRSVWEYRVFSHFDLCEADLSKRRRVA